MLQLAACAAAAYVAPVAHLGGGHRGAAARNIRMDGEGEAITVVDDLSEGQIFGPTKPAHASSRQARSGTKVAQGSRISTANVPATAARCAACGMRCASALSGLGSGCVQ